MPLLAVRGNGPASAYGFGALSGKAAAMTAIATTSVSSNVTSVTFSSIPGTYDDLRLVAYWNVDTAGGTLGIQFNSVTTSSYYFQILSGNGSTASVNRGTANALYVDSLNGAGTSPMIQTVDVFQYASTSTNKPVIMELASDANGSGLRNIAIGSWASNNAITSIKLTLSDYNIISGSVFALYGIKKAS